ncbi:MAG: YIP1 family protein [Ruminococcus sp.]|jgi:hypothetical protein|nr:YIP1 family protein [Ruminococcus sp.]
MLDYNNPQFVGHVLAHPFEGFEDLRWKKQGSIPIAIGIVVLLFVSMVLQDRAYGFQFYVSYDKIFNIVPFLVQSIILFLVWVVANWAMCTLVDGEGSMKRIFIYSAYAMIPYVACTLLGTFLSSFFVQDEGIFLTTIEVIGYAWSGLLIITSQKAVHQFTIRKTILCIILTVLAMIAILFLLVLLLTLMQQVVIFVMSIYTEISYRFRV